mmetsp:Transcript_44541/g.93185  ORF Transcript_44541/g.93185 Transcript_44541/m.93185 type:complete len:329 (-) Transcript_44541:59-1045(-)
MWACCRALGLPSAPSESGSTARTRRLGDGRTSQTSPAAWPTACRHIRRPRSHREVHCIINNFVLGCGASPPSPTPPHCFPAPAGTSLAVPPPRRPAQLLLPCAMLPLPVRGRLVDLDPPFCHQPTASGPPSAHRRRLSKAPSRHLLVAWTPLARRLRPAASWALPAARLRHTATPPASHLRPAGAPAPPAHRLGPAGTPLSCRPRRPTAASPAFLFQPDGTPPACPLRPAGAPPGRSLRQSPPLESSGVTSHNHTGLWGLASLPNPPRQPCVKSPLPPGPGQLNISLSRHAWRSDSDRLGSDRQPPPLFSRATALCSASCWLEVPPAH